MRRPKSISSVFGFIEAALASFKRSGVPGPGFDRSMLPEPVLPSRPEWVELYWKAWELAFGHIRRHNGMPQPVYIDEAFSGRLIWIWDTCFMLHYFKYAHRAFPAVRSLDNFYGPLLDGYDAPVLIRHADNPPLMAWSEEAFFRMTGDTGRLQLILKQKRSLQRYFDYVESFRRNSRVAGAEARVKAQRTHLGYHWGRLASGMDNSPRGKGRSILYVDLAAQQALSALSIARLLEQIGDPDEAAVFRKRHSDLTELVNTHYWDDESGFYFDILTDSPERKTGIRTLASFWPMLAGIAGEHQVERMIDHIDDPLGFGGEYPLPSLARDEKKYKTDGRYWKGGIWAPTSYMVIKGLEKYGHFDLASDLAGKFIGQVAEAYRNVEPHTIWECYEPEAPGPATAVLQGQRCRPDFCGWSALAPVSLLIENILGIYDVDAANKSVRWNLHLTEPHGIKNLGFGDNEIDISFRNGIVTVLAKAPFTLYINNRLYKITDATHEFMVDSDLI